ncbi:hypothetical protein SAMD00019534_086660 [Acytostelium subglobosum LB1]|uniref:hypothetical protein n=1 Tax=Acytostelium subglobosum LB1 TaxID=1410327 RepID=UPI000644819E|nr:hypothetical protein SAMD00019534_086660 [Acytostelium subglobosum LB1]GAM25491.1 hypothetical protein SAMD00019534_086660 [Acytostelium subglobosum LB1]|eukprot:XP_012751477.1 hypothetical protein SAMD00019534_086660 [Acytostelium subglobosum LB1]
MFVGYPSQRSSSYYIDNEPLLTNGKHIVLSMTSTHRSRSLTYDELMVFLKDRADKDIANLKDCWIDCQALDEKEINDICNELGVHYLTKKDIISQTTREKCEFFNNHVFVVVNEIHYEESSNNLVNGRLNLILFPKMMLTIHVRPLISTKQVLRMISYSPTSKFVHTPKLGGSSRTSTSTTSTTSTTNTKGTSLSVPTSNDPGSPQVNSLPSAPFILYSYLDVIVDIYTDLVDKIMYEIRSLDDIVMVLSGMRQEELNMRLGLASKRVTNLNNGVFGKSDIISVLLRVDERFIPKSTLRYLRNVQDHTVRLLQKLTLSQKLLSNLNNIYMARVSLEVSNSSNNIDKSMRKFTAISTIFTPVTLIAAIMGMNVRYPGIYGEPGGDNFYTFIGVLSFMALFATIIALLFKRYGWL